jgi:hypothetical protein
MTRLLQRLGLVCALVVAALPTRAALAQQDAPEPPPAPLVAPDEPEPAPAPLQPVPEPPKAAPEARSDPKAAAAAQSTQQRLRLVRQLRGVGWTGVAFTLSLFTAGVVTGALAQQRSDALSSATAVPAGGVAPVYDASQRANYLSLQSDGQTFNNATIACFAAGSALAVISGVLFWRAERLDPNAKLRVSLAPAVRARGGLLALSGSF